MLVTSVGRDFRHPRSSILNRSVGMHSTVSARRRLRVFKAGTPWVTHSDAMRIAREYAIAITAMALVTLVRVRLEPILGDQIPFVLYMVPITAMAWYCRMGPVLVAVALSL